MSGPNKHGSVLQSLMRVLPMAVLVHQRGLIRYCNQRAQEILGLSLEDLEWARLLELGIRAHPEKRQEAVRILEETGSLRDLEVDFRMRCGEIKTFPDTPRRSFPGRGVWRTDPTTCPSPSAWMPWLGG